MHVRRVLIAALSFLLAAIVSPATAGPTATESQTSGFGGAGHNYVSSVDNREFLVKWTALNTTSQGPCVVGSLDRIVTVALSAGSSTSGSVVAVDSRGQTLWTSPVLPFEGQPGGMFSSTFTRPSCPLIVGDTVIVYSSKTTPFSSEFVAFDANTGAIKWRKDLEGYAVVGPPTTDGSRIYTSALRTADATRPCGSDTQAAAIAWGLDGTMLWCDSGTLAFDAKSGPLRPVVFGGSVVFPLTGGWVRDALTGQRRFEVPIEATFSYLSGTAMASRDGVLYLSRTAGYLDAINDQGAALWSVALPSAPAGRAIKVAVSDQRVYAFHSGQSGNRFAAFNRADGSVLWNKSARVPGEAVAVLGQCPLAILGSSLACFEAWGVALRASDGEALATKELGKARISSDGTALVVDGEWVGWTALASGDYALTRRGDATAPVPGAVSPAPGVQVDQSRPILQFSLSDGEGTGVKQATLILDGVSRDVTGATSFAPGALADGSHSWQLKATDVAGNSYDSGPMTFTVDATAPPAPTVSTTSASGSSRPAFTWPALTDQSGIASYEVSLDGVVVTTLTDCGPCTFEVPTTLGDGVHRVSVTAVDRRGHRSVPGEASVSVAEPPVAALSASTLLVTAGENVVLDAAKSTDNSGVTAYAWDPEGDGTYVPGGATYTFTPRTIGQHRVGVRISDAAGLSSSATAVIEARKPAPTGQLGVSVNGGAQATNNPDVSLALVWPRLATEVRVANDGGFAGSTPVPLEASLTWRLSSSGNERLPKTVYVRFEGGTAGRETYTDDIILDQTAPVISVVKEKGGKPKRGRGLVTRKFRVSASDNASGIYGVQLTNSKSAPGTIQEVDAELSLKSTVSARLKAGTAFVRVVDEAGNPSKWSRVK